MLYSFAWRAAGLPITSRVALVTGPIDATLQSSGNGAKERFEKEGADVITFVSSSAAKHFFALNMPFPEDCKVASIGPVTSATLEVIGKPAALQANEYNIDGLVEAVVALCSE